MLSAKTILVAALACSFGVLAGCQDGEKKNSHGHSGMGNKSGGVGSMSMPPSSDKAGMSGMPGHSMMMAKNDADLVSMLLEHHDGAIRLANLELQRGQNADSKAMAQKIVSLQSSEKQDLTRLQQQVGRGMMMGPEMKQKQAQAEQELSAAQGHGADHVFLKHMSQHHQDGIMMLQMSMPNLRNAELKQMAQKMISDQQEDIQKMKSMMH